MEFVCARDPVVGVPQPFAAIPPIGRRAVPVVPVAGWIVIGGGMAASLYDAAFSTLGTIYGAQSRQAITTLTLFGGFASTICWPLSALLVEHAGWRGTCLSYAAVQLAFAPPVHLVVLPRGSNIGSVGAQAAANHQVRLDGQDQLIFLLLASSLTIAAGSLSRVVRGP